MKPSLLIAILLSCVPGLAFADLGDTIVQSTLKYGEPKPTGDVHVFGYVHDQLRIWQSYNDAGVCVIAEFSPLNHGPLEGQVCADLACSNLPPALKLRSEFKLAQVQWHDSSRQRDTVSYQYTSMNSDSLYQLIVGQSREDTGGWRYYRMYLNTEGIHLIKTGFGAHEE
jgi:hypothetical protein